MFHQICPLFHRRYTKYTYTAVYVKGIENMHSRLSRPPAN